MAKKTEFNQTLACSFIKNGKLIADKTYTITGVIQEKNGKIFIPTSDGNLFWTGKCWKK